MRFAVLPDAEDEAKAARRWYRERSGVTASKFSQELHSTFQRVCRTPLLHAPDDDGFRHVSMATFPYSVVYEVIDDVVTVVAVAHGRRDPGYWKRDR